MKLRIQGNSIRFRVTQSEMAALAAGGRLEESVQFGPAPSEILTYAVETSSECSDVHASYSDPKGIIQVTLPADLVRIWATTGQVGIEHSQPITRGAALKITLEKDFHCLHPGLGEDEGDNFPNPGDFSGGRKVATPGQ